MAISDLYSQTLSALVATRATMLSPEWIANLDDATPASRLAASMNLVELQKAIAALSNTALSDIAQQMTAQQTELTTATSGLTVALKKITNVQKFMDAVTSILTTVAKIVPLL